LNSKEKIKVNTIKNLKMLAFGLVLLLASTSSILAAPVSCTPNQLTAIAGSVGSTVGFTCPGDPAATRAHLIISGSFSDNSGAGPDRSVLFAGNDAGGTFSNLSCLAIGATNGIGQTLGSCVAVGDWIDVAGLSDFLLLISAGPGSDPLPFLGSVSGAVETETPEPGSIVMVGIGLALVLVWTRS
jgi:hypothetical protein